MSKILILLRKDLLSLKNSFLLIIRKPVRLLPYMFIVAYVVFIMFSTQQENPVYDSMGKWIPAFISVLFIGQLLYLLYNAEKQQVTFFTMADVNILFNTPISPRIILLYYQIRQSIIFLLGAFAMVYYASLFWEQFPYGDTFGIFIMVCSMAGFSIVTTILRFLIFSVGTKTQKIGWLKSIAIGLFAAIIGYLTYLWNISPIEGTVDKARLLLESEYLNYIPFAGWAKGAFVYFQTGELFPWFYLLMASVVLFQLATLWAADDYYEDVLDATKEKDMKVAKAKGQTKQEAPSFVLNKSKNIKVKSGKPFAGALFWKSKLDYTRQDFHYLFGVTNIALVLIAGLVGWYFSDIEKPKVVFYIFNMLFAMLYYMAGLGATINGELTKHYFFLLPDSNYRKLFNLTAVESTRVLLTGLICNLVIFAFIPVQGWFIPAWVFIVLSYYWLGLTLGIIVQVIWPDKLDQMLFRPFIIMFQIIMIIPFTLLGAAAGMFLKSFAIGLIGVLLLNMLVVGIFTFFADQIISRYELA